MKCAGVMMCMCVLHEARICREKGEKLVYKAAAQCETAKQRVKDQDPSLAHSATSVSEA